MSAMVAIQINGLTKKFANGDGVEQVTLSVRKGEIVALLGPNGAGKTTTLRCLTGMYKPDQGSLLLEGFPAGSVQAQKITAFIPDHPYLYPALTVGEHVQFRARAFHVDRKCLKEKVLQALTDVHLEQLVDRMSGELSRGQKQRVLLAGAAVQDAKLYVLDEPTVGLDIPAKQWLAKWLRTKAQQQCAILVSTHSLEFVLETAHRVLLIQGGCMASEMAVPKEEATWPKWKQEVIRALGEWTDD